MSRRLSIRVQIASAFSICGARFWCRTFPPLRLKDVARMGHPAVAAICRLALFLLLTVGAAVQILAQTDQPPGPVVLDRVVAVVNNQAILASDIDDEIRLSVLDPGRGGLGALTRVKALDQLIGRALIQQQIGQEDLESSAPPQAEVDARLGEIRKELPACVRQNCASDEGWKAFLAAHGLTQEHVETYLRYRLEILRFIERRFRQGISILPQEIETYYHDTLVPQYAKGEAIPPLDAVSARIEEILLQQRVNALFDDWLNNLRKQGEVEVLDPTLEVPVVAPPPALASSAIAIPGGKKGSQ
jgi:peptidyl-prolyl cis-trans isomerase SurA